MIKSVDALIALRALRAVYARRLAGDGFRPYRRLYADRLCADQLQAARRVLPAVGTCHLIPATYGSSNSSAGKYTIEGRQILAHPAACPIRSRVRTVRLRLLRRGAGVLG